jgi:hypothetical protein
MTDLEMAARLRRAADAVRGAWWQCGDGDGLVKERGGQCARNWLSYPDGDNVLYRESWPVSDLVEERLGRSIYGWNDAPERTKQEVIALFEGLAHDLELRHQIAASPPLVELHSTSEEPATREASPSLLKEAVHA